MPQQPNMPTFSNYGRAAKPRQASHSGAPEHIPKVTPSAPAPRVSGSNAVRLLPSTPVTSTPRPVTTRQVSTSTSGSQSTPRPRKRFRKKVSGLFADNSDLKNRIAKMMVKPDLEKLFSISAVDAAANKKIFPPLISRPRFGDSPSSDYAVQKLTEIALRNEKEKEEKIKENGGKDPDPIVQLVKDDEDLRSFDYPEFTAQAIRALGSVEKLNKIRKYMGSADPHDMECFLDELEIGLPTKLCAKSSGNIPADGSADLKPPKLRRVNSSEFVSRRSLSQSSPTGVARVGARECIAVPAVHRRRAKRIERGYSAADVLLARKQGTSLAEVTASPIGQRRKGKNGRAKFTRNQVKKMNLNTKQGEKKHGRSLLRPNAKSKTKLEQESQRTETDSGHVTSSANRALKKTDFKEGPASDMYRRGEYSSIDPLHVLVQVAAQAESAMRMRDAMRELKMKEGGSKTEVHAATQVETANKLSKPMSVRGPTEGMEQDKIENGASVMEMAQEEHMHRSVRSRTTHKQENEIEKGFVNALEIVKEERKDEVKHKECKEQEEWIGMEARTRTGSEMENAKGEGRRKYGRSRSKQKKKEAEAKEYFAGVEETGNEGRTDKTKRIGSWQKHEIEKETGIGENAESAREITIADLKPKFARKRSRGQMEAGSAENFASEGSRPTAQRRSKRKLTLGSGPSLGDGQ